MRRFHSRDAEYAEESPFAQSGDGDWAKTFNFNLRSVKHHLPKSRLIMPSKILVRSLSTIEKFLVCRRLPTNKKSDLCVLCLSTGSRSRAQSRDASAVIYSFSAMICVNLRLISPYALRSAPCAFLFLECLGRLNINSVKKLKNGQYDSKSHRGFRSG